jgi:hypothetical protein
MRVKILLDTSFLLPIIGIRVREVEDLLERLWTRYKGVRSRFTIQS